MSGRTDIGVVRTENQDQLLLCDRCDEADGFQGVLLAVADGMGGLRGGSIASRIAAEALRAEVASFGADIERELAATVRRANQEIYRYSLRDGDGESMGSTITAVALADGEATIAQVGDSRAYRIRGSQLKQLTRDHSLLQELLDRGHVTDTESLQFHRNILTRGLGLRDEVEVDIYRIRDVRDGDVFLVSSDGLHDVVGDDVLRAVVEEYGSDLEGLCDALISRARERGGPDNITVAVARCGKEESPLQLRDEESVVEIQEEVEEPSMDGSARVLPLVVVSFLTGVLSTLLFESPPTSAANRSPADADRVLQELHERPELRDHVEALRSALEAAKTPPAERAPNEDSPSLDR
ncbi:MAG: protein phosphatase 2C domain-containing protein [Planctomycetota bacterium]